MLLMLMVIAKELSAFIEGNKDTAFLKISKRFSVRIRKQTFLTQNCLLP